MSKDKIKLKQARYLLNVLTKDENCIFHNADSITKTLVKK